MTIYTDLSYAFGVVHKFGALWSEQGFITSTGAPVKNGQWIANLLQAIILPFQVAVIKYDSHTGGSDDVSRRNAGADKAAKSTAISEDALLVSQCALTPATTMPWADIKVKIKNKKKLVKVLSIMVGFCVCFLTLSTHLRS